MAKRRTKDLLIQEGVKQIRKDGITKLSLRKVANACQLTHVATYRHFKNKNEFVANIMPEVAKNFSIYLSEGDDESKTPRERLEYLAKRFLEYSENETHSFDFIFLSEYSTVTEIDSQGELDLVMELESFRYIKERIQSFVNSLEGDYDFNTVFIQLWSLVFGMCILIRRGIYSHGTINPEKIVSNTLDFFK